MYLMKHFEYSVQDSGIPVKIAYIGGGSLNWALGLMADLAHDTQLAADVRLYDINNASVARNAKIGQRFAEVSKGTPATYSISSTIGQALEGADLVVISILPGRFDDMAQDIGIPEKYGIKQAVGDTVGPGGFLRALRSIPMMVEIGEAIRKYSPHAYVCNLTNPMSVLTGAMFRAHPDIKCWGECHEVTKLRKQVAWIENSELGVDKWSFRDVDVNVLGINHFTFVDKMSLGGKDMLPAYRAFATAHDNSGWVAQKPDPNDEFAKYFEDESLVKFDLYNRFGIPAAAGDRHLAEFVSTSQYIDRHNDWKFGLTPVEFRVRENVRKKKIAEDLAAGEIIPVAKRSAEALLDQIIALFSGKTFISNVNLPNQGQITGLPLGTIVETNAVFSGNGIAPISAGSLPNQLHDIVADHAARQTDLLDAVLEHRYDDLFALFKTDPMVRDLSEAKAYSMFQEMISATAPYLPEGLRKAVA